jgi:cytochrome c553
VILLAYAVLVIGWPGGAEAGDPAMGRQKAVACRTCHGLDGLSRQPDAPHIAGQVAVYLRDQLGKYRSGERAHPVMEVIAKQLSNADIEDLVAYYASIKLSVETPP